MFGIHALEHFQKFADAYVTSHLINGRAALLRRPKSGKAAALPYRQFQTRPNPPQIICNFSALCGSELNKVMILRIVIGLLVGGGSGFAWYKFIGCSTGACPLTSHPVVSTIYGAVLGVLIATNIH